MKRKALITANAGGPAGDVNAVLARFGFQVAVQVADRAQAIKRLGDEIATLIDWHSHSNARCRQLASPSVQLAGATNPLGTNFGEVRRHGELSWIDGVEPSFGSNADLKAPMQFACWIENIRFAPCHDRTAFDESFRKAARIEATK